MEDYALNPLQKILNAHLSLCNILNN